MSLFLRFCTLELSLLLFSSSHTFNAKIRTPTLPLPWISSRSFRNCLTSSSYLLCITMTTFTDLTENQRKLTEGTFRYAEFCLLPSHGSWISFIPFLLLIPDFSSQFSCHTWTTNTAFQLSCVGPFSLLQLSPAHFPNAFSISTSLLHHWFWLPVERIPDFVVSSSKSVTCNLHLH